MSQEIDKKVVSLEFDNAKFEQGTAKTRKSIKDLVGSLNEIGTAAYENNAHLIKMVTQITMVKKATEDTMDAIKNFAKALTIKPAKSGMEEYTTQINAIQTILANTQHAGTTLKQVTSALDELNVYADKTIYNFTEMTKNIGTFTAAGISLKNSTSSIQGIANLAAVSGANSQKASVAMYQLSQALAAGSLKLQDWNSVVNAGMGGKIFQDALKETAEMYGTNVDAIIKKEGSFRESLKKGWITTDVLTETLTKFTVSGANEYLAKMANTNTITVKAMRENADAAENVNEAYRDMAKYLAQTSTLSEDQIYKILNMSKTAEDAATKVKTFEQLVDTLNEAMQSGWTKTWELIVGDFYQAQEMFTEISDTFGAIIDDFSSTRNEMVGMVMNSSWETLSSKVKEAGIDLYDFQDRLIDASGEYREYLRALLDSGSMSFEDTLQYDWLTEGTITKTIRSYTDSMYDFMTSTGQSVQSLAHYEQVVNDVINGFYGSGSDAIDNIIQAGYNYNYVSALVSATLNGQAIDWQNLTNAEMRNYGISEEQIKILDKLNARIEDTSDGMHDVANSMSKPSGRTKMLNAIKNSLTAITKVINVVRRAFNDTFGIKHTDFVDLLDVIESLSQKLLKMATENDNLYRTFKGVFSIVATVTDTINDLAKSAFVRLGGAVANSKFTILDLTAAIGDNLAKLRSWLQENNLLTFVFDAVLDRIVQIGSGIETFVLKVFKMDNFVSVLRTIESALRSFSYTLKKYTHIDLGFLADGVGKLASINEISFDPFFDSLSYLVSRIKDAITAMLNPFGIFNKELNNEINSASETTTALSEAVSLTAMNLPDHEVSKPKSFLEHLLATLISYKDKIVKVCSMINPASLIALGFSVASLIIINTFAKTLDKIRDVLEGIDGVLEAVENMFAAVGKAFAKAAKAFAFKEYANGILSLATSVLVLSGAIFVLSKIDKDQLWGSLGVVAILAVIVGVMMGLMSKVGVAGKFTIIATPTLISIGAIMLLLVGLAAYITKHAADIDSHAIIAVEALFVFVTALAALIGVAMSKIASVTRTVGLKSIGLFIGVISALSAGLSMIVFAFSKINAEGIGGKIGAFFAIVAALAALAAGVYALSYFLKSKGFGITSLKSALTLVGPMATVVGFSLSMAIILASLGAMTPEKVANAKNAIDNLIGLFIFYGVLLGVVSVVGGEFAHKVGVLAMGIGVGIAGLSTAVLLLGLLPRNVIHRGIASVAALMTLFTAMLVLVEIFQSSVMFVENPFSGKDAALIVLAVAGAIVAMTGVIAALGLMDIPTIAKGLVPVLLLITMFSGIIAAMHKLPKFNAATAKMMYAFMGCLIALGASVVALSFFPWYQSLAAAGGVAAVLLVLGKVMDHLGELATKAPSMMFDKIMTPLMITILGIGASLALIAHNDWVNIAAAAGAMAVCMGVLVLVYQNLNKMSMAASPSGSFIAIFSILSGVMIAMGILIAIISAKAKDYQTVLVAGGMISLMMIALIGMVDAIGKMATAAMAIQPAGIVKVAILLIMALAAVNAIVYGVKQTIFVMKDLPTNTAVVDNFIKMLYAILGATAIVVAGAAALGTLAKGAIGYIAIGAGLILAVGGIAGLLMETFEDRKMERLNKAASFAEKYAILADAMQKIAASMKEMNVVDLSSLSTFFEVLTNLVDKNNEIGNVQDNQSKFDALQGNVVALAQVIKTFGDELDNIGFGDKQTAALKTAIEAIANYQSIVDSTYDFTLTGNSLMNVSPEEWSDFKLSFENLITTMNLVANKYNIVKTDWFDAAKLGVTSFSELIKVFSGKEFSNGLKQIISDSDVKWSNLQSSFSMMMLTIDILATRGNFDKEKFDKSLTAIKEFATAKMKVDNSGSLIDWVCTKSSLTTFGKGMTDIGNALSSFNTSITNVDKDKITTGVDCIKQLAEVDAAKLQKWDHFSWDSSKVNLGELGEDLKQFFEGMQGIDGKIHIDFTSVQYAISIVGDMVSAMTLLKTSVVGAYVIDFGAFKTNYEEFYKIIYKAISDFSGLNTAGFNNGDAAKKVVELLEDFNNRSFNYIRIGAFEDYLYTFGSSISDFYDDIEGMNGGQFYSIANGILKLSEAFAMMSTINQNGIVTFDAMVESLIKSSIKDLLKAYKDSEQDLKTVGANIAKSIADGLNEKQQDLKKTFYDFGQSLISALTDGIKEDEELMKAIENLGTKMKNTLTDSVAPEIGGHFATVTTNAAKSGGAARDMGDEGTTGGTSSRTKPVIPVPYGWEGTKEEFYDQYFDNPYVPQSGKSKSQFYKDMYGIDIEPKKYESTSKKNLITVNEMKESLQSIDQGVGSIDKTTSDGFDNGAVPDLWNDAVDGIKGIGSNFSSMFSNSLSQFDLLDAFPDAKKDITAKIMNEILSGKYDENFKSNDPRKDLGSIRRDFVNNKLSDDILRKKYGTNELNAALLYMAGGQMSWDSFVNNSIVPDISELQQYTSAVEETGKYKKKYKGFNSEISKTSSKAKSEFDEYFEDYKEKRIEQADFDKKYADNAAKVQNDLAAIYSKGIAALESDYAALEAEGKATQDDYEEYLENRQELYEEYIDAMNDYEKHTSDKIRDYVDTTLENVNNNFEKKLQDIQSKIDNLKTKLSGSLSDSTKYTTRADAHNKEIQGLERQLEKEEEITSDYKTIYSDQNSAADAWYDAQKKINKLVKVRDKYAVDSKEYKAANHQIKLIEQDMERQYGKEETRLRRKEVEDEMKTKWRELSKLTYGTREYYDAQRELQDLEEELRQLDQQPYIIKNSRARALKEDGIKYKMDDKNKEYKYSVEYQDDADKKANEIVKVEWEHKKTQDETKKINEYADMIEKLKAKAGGKLTDNMLEYISSMDLDTGYATVQALLKLSNAELKQTLSEQEAKEAAGDRVARLLYTDKVKDAFNQYVKDMEDTIGSLPESAQEYGRQTAQQFAQSFSEETQNILKNMNVDTGLLSDIIGMKNDDPRKDPFTAALTEYINTPVSERTADKLFGAFLNSPDAQKSLWSLVLSSVGAASGLGGSWGSGNIQTSGITPVKDADNPAIDQMASQMSTSWLTTLFGGQGVVPVDTSKADTLNDSITNLTTAINNSNPNDNITALRNEFDAKLTQLESKLNFNILLDGKSLVGGIFPRINTAMGATAAVGGRGR